MKRLLLLCLSLAVAAFVVVMSSSPTPVLSQSNGKGGGNNDGIPESVIKRGFEIAPVPLNLRGKNRALVGLGSYNVNAQGGCSDCHTNPPYAAGGDPFAGEPEQINVPCYLSGGTDFGIVRSRNLTPDSHGLPGGLTLEEFLHVLRTGEDTTSPGDPPFDGGLLQIMPWPVYGKMTDRDLRAIYEYLSAIPSRPRCV